jgi:hypothetical protein
MSKNKTPDKVHFHVYDINSEIRREFVGLCKLEGLSASRTAERLMSRYVEQKKKALMTE